MIQTSTNLAKPVHLAPLSSMNHDTPPSSLNWNSHSLTHGWQRGIHAFYWGLGFTPQDFEKPQIGIGTPLLGKLLHVDTLSMRFRTFTLRRDPECPVCGTTPSITEPIDYEGFCGMPSFSPNTMNPPPQVPTLTVQELDQLRKAGTPHFLLDVREPDEFQTARIEGSTLIPLASLPLHTNEVPKGKQIVVHCKLGGRSAKAVAFLLENGFTNVWNVAGGITAWSEQVDPTIPKY
jgi:adenylyltransferase/sulfurtransferase